MTTEARRKISHWFILLVPISYVFIFPQRKDLVLLSLGVLILVVVVFELLRHNNDKLNQKLLNMFEGIYRKEEVKNTSTLIYTLSGIFFAIFFFSKEIAVLSILFLTFGDGFAALVGERYGKHKIYYKKSLEGTITNLIVCLILGFLFSKFFPIRNSQILFGSLVATIIEILPVKDNLLIPVCSALAMTIV
ncbi:MAG: hypothetical protein A2474_01490 [Elusimicrobia bacterium RIFOXYC2_FULL_34_12]|nr:MAG: hypothetical protein A2474_01490 [Elusimicrobia bacterium RIFOXYC2_FULL_34_12]OGS38914.1 MAG: hypothetical protein A2551_03585 [Elusimicrobia bacterium RIFOXYD2_FULL_34_30]HAM39029.1 hypothetical protein [Elusimicrobiota bacterium]